MFASNSSSDDDSTDRGPQTPFHAVSAAAAAQRQKAARQATRRRVSRARPAGEDAEAVAYDEAMEAVETERRARRAAGRPAAARESRYIGKLVAKVEERKEEAERVAERRLLREQAKEDALYAGKDAFVTRAYQEKLAQRAEKDRRDVEEEEEEEEAERLRKGRHGWRSGQAFGGGMGARVVSRGGENGGDGDGAESQGASESLEVVSGEVCKETSAPVARRRRRRFTDGPVDSVGGDENTERGGGKAVPVPVKTAANTERGNGGLPQVKTKRGMRRNDSKAIEAYKQRYFSRLEQRRSAPNSSAGEAT